MCLIDWLSDLFQQRIMELEKEKTSLKTALDTQIEQMSTIQRSNKEVRTLASHCILIDQQDTILRQEYEEKLKRAEVEYARKIFYSC